MKSAPQAGIRERIAQGFTLVEDAVYLSLALPVVVLVMVGALVFLRKHAPIRAERAM